MPDIPKFSQDQCATIVSRALGYLDTPEGCEVRSAVFTEDLLRISKLPLSDEDTINPCYGMAPPDSLEDLTLVVDIHGEVAGQVSSSIVVEIENDTLLAQVDVSGIFISDEHRGEGLGKSLGTAVIAVTQAWIEHLSDEEHLDFEGIEIEVSGDTLPGSAGEGIIEMMQSIALPDEEEPSLST
jgi:GNAT superfamily N-acetyltransferase